MRYHVGGEAKDAVMTIMIRCFPCLSCALLDCDVCGKCQRAYLDLTITLLLQAPPLLLFCLAICYYFLLFLQFRNEKLNDIVPALRQNYVSEVEAFNVAFLSPGKELVCHHFWTFISKLLDSWYGNMLNLKGPWRRAPKTPTLENVQILEVRSYNKHQLTGCPDWPTS